jgi:hypothetical protein
MTWFSHLSHDAQVALLLYVPQQVLNLNSEEGVSFWMEYRNLKDKFTVEWGDYRAINENELLDRYLHCLGMMDSISRIIGIAISVWLENSKCL